MASEALVEQIFSKVLGITNDTVATACLFRLTDKGVLNLRELPEAARQLMKRFDGDLTGLTDVTVTHFQSCAQIEGGRE